MGVKGSVDPHISYSMTFLEWEAANAANATLQELYDLSMGKYPVWFRARLIAWYQMHRLVKMHEEAASSEAAAKKGKHK